LITFKYLFYVDGYGLKQLNGPGGLLGAGLLLFKVSNGYFEQGQLFYCLVNNPEKWRWRWGRYLEKRGGGWGGKGRAPSGGASIINESLSLLENTSCPISILS